MNKTPILQLYLRSDFIYPVKSNFLAAENGHCILTKVGSNSTNTVFLGVNNRLYRINKNFQNVIVELVYE